MPLNMVSHTPSVGKISGSVPVLLNKQKSKQALGGEVWSECKMPPSPLLPHPCLCLGWLHGFLYGGSGRNFSLAGLLMEFVTLVFFVVGRKLAVLWPSLGRSLEFPRNNVLWSVCLFVFVPLVYCWCCKLMYVSNDDRNNYNMNPNIIMQRT